MALPQSQFYMESDYYNLPEDVREYWIVNPMAQSVYVYYLDEEQFETTAYTFQDQIKTMIYEDLCIDFKQLEL